MSKRVVPLIILLGACLIGLLTGCAQKKAGFTQPTASTGLKEKDRAAFRGGPMPASAREKMAEWIKKSEANQKNNGNGATAKSNGPTAAEAAAAAMK